MGWSNCVILCIYHFDDGHRSCIHIPGGSSLVSLMHKDRALWASLGMLALAGAAFALRETGGAGWMPGCVFRKLTALDCPGCGMTRGTYALLHGRVADAFAFNPVGMILLPLAMIALGIEVLGWVRGKPMPFRMKPGRWGATIVAVVVIGWWVGRNLF
jgi:hypothetical protein